MFVLLLGIMQQAHRENEKKLMGSKVHSFLARGVAEQPCKQTPVTLAEARSLMRHRSNVLGSSKALSQPKESSGVLKKQR